MEPKRLEFWNGARNMAGALDMLASLALLESRQGALGATPMAHQHLASPGGVGAFALPLIADQHTSRLLAGMNTWGAPPHTTGFGSRGHVSSMFCPTFSPSSAHVALAGQASKRHADAEAKYRAAVASVSLDVLGRQDHSAAARKSAFVPVAARTAAFVPSSAKAHAVQVARPSCSTNRRDEDDAASSDSTQDAEEDVSAGAGGAVGEMGAVGTEGFSLHEYCVTQMKIDPKKLKKSALVRILDLSQLFRTLHSKVHNRMRPPAAPHWSTSCQRPWMLCTLSADCAQRGRPAFLCWCV